MNRDQVWKSLDLGKELDIAGTFIYNGLRAFNEMETLDHTEEIFEFLYNLSVGIERLLKVAVIFLEHDESQDQGKLEQSLITHNHLDLLARVRRNRALPLAGLHNEFLNLLGTFYRSFRYDRFTRSLAWNPAKEREALLRFIAKHLGVAFDEPYLFATANDARYRRFVGNLVSKIAMTLYDLVSEQARSLNLYTWERRVDSKASKVFDGRSFTFESEDILIKELLLFFMNSDERSGLIDHLRSIPPLAFDPALAQDYFACFRSEEAKLRVLSELEALYEDVDDRRARLEMLTPIGDTSIIFWSDLDAQDALED